MKYIFILGIVLGILLLIPGISAVSWGYYTIPVLSLTNNPADSVTSFFGNLPCAPNTMATTNNIYGSGYNRVVIPTGGVIERVEIYENSTANSNNAAYPYFIRINNGTSYLIANLTVAGGERIVSNSTLRISVNAGDFFEISRVHPAWSTNPTALITGGYIFINSTTKGYVVPMMTLTHSPADSVTNYMCWRPTGPMTQGQCTQRIPSGGNITRVDIVDNSSGTTGTGEQVSYYVPVGNGNDVLVQSVLTTNGNRTFTNAAMTGAYVPHGFDLEFKRVNPLWITNPLLNIDAGTAFIDTSLNTVDVEGYPLYVQALTSSPADGATIYFGNLPKVPIVNNGKSKIYIPKSGTINRVFIIASSGSSVGTIAAGSTTNHTGEPWSLYIRKNDAADTMVGTVSSISAEEMWSNDTVGLSVSQNDYIEIKCVNPTWAVNPLLTIFGGYVFVDYGDPVAPHGGDILPPVSDFSANVSSTTAPAVMQFFDQSNNTVPSTTSYYWNFTDGGTTVDSTDKNPIFRYSTFGTKTINHTITGGGVTSTHTGTVTLSGGTATSPPNASFNIILSDTSTQYPTIWKWNVTNLLGNNTEVIYSTAQNPVLNLRTGNWRINFTATNSFGSNTTDQTIGINLSSPKVYFWSRTA